jgi:methylthioribose-1-phosphate isomerase
MKTKDKTTADLKASIDYELAVKRHEEFISKYRFYLDRICKLLKHRRPTASHPLWTVEEIRSTIENEINMSESMDAPNKPGYYRANND